MSTTSANFDCADVYSEHAFLVALTRGKSGKAQIFEVFGRAPDPSEREWSPEIILRCEVPRATWDAVSAEIRSEFNRRLKQDGKPAGRFGAEDTAVQRLLGKEMLVLLWAIEHEEVSAEQTMVAIRNWLGLKPEERWWLYTMTAAATGYAHQVGLGWRMALRDALCFGTRRDSFVSSALPQADRLPPRTNDGFAPPAAKKPARKPRRKKSEDKSGYLFQAAE